MTTKEKPCHAIPPKKPTSHVASDTPSDAQATTSESTELAQRMQADIELQEQADLIAHEYETNPGIPPSMSEDERLATWYVGKDAQFDQMIATIKEQSAAMIRQIESRRRGMAYRFGQQVRETVERMLRSQGGKKRSVKLLTGTAGFRKQPEKLTIVDPAAVLEWADFNCPAAINRECRITPIKEHFKNTGEVPPGVHLTEERDAFYPDCSAHQLPFTPPQGIE